MSLEQSEHELRFIKRKSSNNFVTNKNESKVDCIKKVTHLYMNDKFIKKIGSIDICVNLVVLYLHNNDISKIENINCAENLTTLYLQNNKISTIENLNGLRKLKKLYIGLNNIRVIEGLELTNLEELYCEKQRLAKGETICFDPRTILNLSHSLRVLNISHNNINSMDELAPLKYLTKIDASHNKLCDVHELCNILINWYELYEAHFKENPICKVHRYRENIIAHTHKLKNLDGKDISEITRSFMKRFEKEKLNAKRCINFANDIPDIPKNLSLSMQKAVTFSMIKPQHKEEFTSLSTSESNIYVPWRAMPINTTLPKQVSRKARSKPIPPKKIEDIDFVTRRFPKFFEKY